MPQGSFLSNPSTAPDGPLGAGGAMLPPTPQINMWGNATPGYNTNIGADQNGPLSGMFNAFSQVGNALSRINAAEANRQRTGIQLWQPFQLPGALGLFQNQGQLQKPNQYVSPFATNAAQSTAGASGAASPTPITYGGVIPVSIANRQGAMDGMTAQQTAAEMQAAGYVQRWVEDLGQVWVPASNTAGGSTTPGGGGGFGGTDERGRPEFVDGASLQPGESVIDANGNRWVGGTPTETGEAQYALNLANPAARDDKHGKYKWVSEVRKDSSGNWIRVNRQVLRKVYTRSHLKKKASQRQKQENKSAAANATEFNQLVNFRANYG